MTDDEETGFPIWYPVFGLAVIALAIYVLWRNWGWWRTDGGGEFELWFFLALGAILTFMVFAGAMGLAAGLSSILRDCFGQEMRVCWKGRMVSLRGADGVAGSISGGIFMMSGHVGSEQFYTYYTSGDDGAFHPHKWKAGSGTRVFEEDRKDGEVVQWHHRFKKPWQYWLSEPDDDLSMDFHIPKGSLKQAFSLE